MMITMGSGIPSVGVAEEVASLLKLLTNPEKYQKAFDELDAKLVEIRANLAASDAVVAERARLDEAATAQKAEDLRLAAVKADFEQREKDLKTREDNVAVDERAMEATKTRWTAYVDSVSAALNAKLKEVDGLKDQAAEAERNALDREEAARAKIEQLKSALGNG